MAINLVTETKATLAAKLEQATQEATQNKLLAENAVALANYFEFNLTTIENLILKSPIGKKGKFVATIFFLVSNFKEIRALIEGIVNQITQWREKVEELKAQAQAARSNADNA